MVKGSDTIKVFARFRPLNDKEAKAGENGKMAVQFTGASTVKILDKDLNFTVDRIFNTNTTQEEVYDNVADTIVTQIVNGYNGTIFAYGQTSSGKTYTMEGPSLFDQGDMGVIPRSISTIFDAILKTNDQVTFTLKLSMIEIYNEVLNDLLDLSRTQLKIRENITTGNYVAGLSEFFIKSPQDALKLIQQGTNNRTTASTAMNKESSRSHSIVILSLTQKNLITTTSKFGTLYLVDLAGSEKIDKTGATGVRLEEAKKINLSLLTLNRVISALTEKGSKHIPYLDSKLTKILQESLGGNSRTALICNCSPSLMNIEETISTLRFATSAKKVYNKAKVNMDEGSQQYKMMYLQVQKENESLKELVDKLKMAPEEHDRLKQDLADAQTRILELEAQIEQQNIDYSNLDQKANYLDRLVNEKAARIEEVEMEYNKLVFENSEMKNISNIQDHEDKIKLNAVQNELDKLKELYERAKSNLKGQTIANDHMKNEMDRKSSENSDLRHKILELQEALDGQLGASKFQEQATEYDQKMKDVRDEYQNKINDLSKQNTELRFKMEDLNRLYEAEKSDLNVRITYLEERAKSRSKLLVSQQSTNQTIPINETYRTKEYQNKMMESTSQRYISQNEIVPSSSAKKFMEGISNVFMNFKHILKHKTLSWGERDVDRDFEKSKAWVDEMISMVDKAITEFTNLTCYFVQIQQSLTKIYTTFDLYYNDSKVPNQVLMSNYTSTVLPVINSVIPGFVNEIAKITNSLKSKLNFLYDLQELSNRRHKAKMEYEHYQSKLNDQLSNDRRNRNLTKFKESEFAFQKANDEYYESFNFYKNFKAALVKFEYNHFRIQLLDFSQKLVKYYSQYQVKPMEPYDYTPPSKRNPSSQLQSPPSEFGATQMEQSQFVGQVTDKMKSMRSENQSRRIPNINVLDSMSSNMISSQVAFSDQNINPIKGENNLKKTTLAQEEQFYVIATQYCFGDLNKNILQIQKDDIILVKGDHDTNFYWASCNGYTGYVLKSATRPMNLQ